jgi:hypothetical protein
MSIFKDEIQLFRDIQDEIHDVIISCIKKFDFVLLDYQTNKQMNIKGETSTGAQIGVYRERYKRYRISKGLQVDHVDLRLTGKFQSTLEIVTESDQFKIVAHVDYADKLAKQFGPEILGLQEKYLSEFVNNYLVPEIRKMIQNKLRTNG